MAESFISSDENKINQLKTRLIYGDLFNEKLFYNDNFKELFNKMDEIKSIESKKSKKENEIKKEEIGIKKSDIDKSGKIKKIKDNLKRYE